MAKFFREKSQIVVLSTFDQREFKKTTKYFETNAYSVQERVKNALSCKLYFFFCQNMFFFIHIDQKYSMNQFEIFPYSIHAYF